MGPMAGLCRELNNGRPARRRSIHWLSLLLHVRRKEFFRLILISPFGFHLCLPAKVHSHLLPESRGDQVPHPLLAAGNARKLDILVKFGTMGALHQALCSS